MAMEPLICRKDKISRTSSFKTARKAKAVRKKKAQRRKYLNSCGVFMLAGTNPEAIMSNISCAIHKGMPLLSVISKAKFRRNAYPEKQSDI